MTDYDKLNDALNEIDDRYLKEAGASKKKAKRKLWWLGGVAAMLAVVIFLTSGGMGAANPQVSTGEQSSDGNPTQSPLNGLTAWLSGGLLAAPEYPDMAPYPENPNTEYDTPAYKNWQAGLQRQYDQPEYYADGLDAFFTNSIPLFLTESEENVVCAPLNLYMALSMLAETTGGSSRDSVLAALNAGSMESLRTQAGHVWNAHYRADGAAACLLANSLWLNDGYAFDRSTVNTLADSYYAWVYQGALGSDAMNNALRDWLSQQTQGLLDESIDNAELSPEDALALASTVYFQARWDSPFRANRSTIDMFHSPAGDVETIYMNKTLTYGPYYYGEDYGAVCLGLDPAGVYGEAAMWLILPDEGYAVWDILESGHALNMILTGRNRSYAEIKVHLSLPKFDISAETDLQSSLTALGLGDLYDPDKADFTAILPDTEGVCLGKTAHAARVAIDEEGVTAAAYTMMTYVGAPVPPEEEVYFTLDRPFLFVITSSDGLPLFAGVVNEP